MYIRTIHVLHNIWIIRNSIEIKIRKYHYIVAVAAFICSHIYKVYNVVNFMHSEYKWVRDRFLSNMFVLYIPTKANKSMTAKLEFHKQSRIWSASALHQNLITDLPWFDLKLFSHICLFTALHKCTKWYIRNMYVYYVRNKNPKQWNENKREKFKCKTFAITNYKWHCLNEATRLDQEKRMYYVCGWVHLRMRIHINNSIMLSS